MYVDTNSQYSRSDRLWPWLLGSIGISAASMFALRRAGAPMDWTSGVVMAASCVPLISSGILLLRLWMCLARQRSPAITAFGARFGGRTVVLTTVAVFLILTLARERVIPGFYTANLYQLTTSTSFRGNERNSSMSGSVSGLTGRLLVGVRAEPEQPASELTIQVRERDASSAASIRRQFLALCPVNIELSGHVVVAARFPRFLLPLYKSETQSIQVDYDISIRTPGQRARVTGSTAGTLRMRSVGLLSAYEFREELAGVFARLLLDRARNALDDRRTSSR